MKNKKIYLVMYSEGDWEMYEAYDVFVTRDLEKAKAWINKFNSILEKWKKYFDEMEKPGRYPWLEVDWIFHKRYRKIKFTNEAFYKEIELR